MPRKSPAPLSLASPSPRSLPRPPRRKLRPKDRVRWTQPQTAPNLVLTGSVEKVIPKGASLEGNTPRRLHPELSKSWTDTSLRFERVLVREDKTKALVIVRRGLIEPLDNAD